MQTTMCCAKIIFFVVLVQAIGTDSFHLGGVKTMRTEDVYLGWPHVIKCNRPHYWTSLCKIVEKATGNILHDEPTNGRSRGLNLGDVTEDTPTEYVITYQDEDSEDVEKVEEYIINAVSSPKETIEKSLEDKSLYFHMEATIGDRKQMDCDPVSGESLPNPKTCSWYYNGTEIRTFDDRNYEGSCQRNFPEVKREDFGVYSCAVNYKGQSRFMIHNTLCYKPARTYNREPFICPSEPFKVKVGENKTIAIKAVMGNGRHNSLDMSFEWTTPKKDEWYCYNWSPRQEPYPSSDHTNHCQVIKLPTSEPQCTMDIASIYPEENFQTVVETHLIFSNVKMSDFGVYKVTHWPAWKLDIGGCSITLEEDNE